MSIEHEHQADEYDPEPIDRRTGAQRARTCNRTEYEVYREDRRPRADRALPVRCLVCGYPDSSHAY